MLFKRKPKITPLKDILKQTEASLKRNKKPQLNDILIQTEATLKRNNKTNTVEMIVIPKSIKKKSPMKSEHKSVELNVVSLKLVKKDVRILEACWQWCNNKGRGYSGIFTPKNVIKQTPNKLVTNIRRRGYGLSGIKYKRPISKTISKQKNGENISWNAPIIYDDITSEVKKNTIEAIKQSRIHKRPVDTCILFQKGFYRLFVFIPLENKSLGESIIKNVKKARSIRTINKALRGYGEIKYTSYNTKIRRRIFIALVLYVVFILAPICIHGAKRGKQEKPRGPRPEDTIPTREKQGLKLFGLNPGYTKDELTQVYKQLSLKYHPDKGGDHGKMVKINDSYEVLKKWLKEKENEAKGKK